MSESEAVELIESKLNKESLRVSSLSVTGKDDNGNYIITQSSIATTTVMEWYHLNPVTQEITCEILEDMCLEEVNDNDIDIQIELTSEQKKARQLKFWQKRTSDPDMLKI